MSAADFKFIVAVPPAEVRVIPVLSLIATIPEITGAERNQIMAQTLTIAQLKATHPAQAAQIDIEAKAAGHEWVNTSDASKAWVQSLKTTTGMINRLNAFTNDLDAMGVTWFRYNMTNEQLVGTNSSLATGFYAHVKQMLALAGFEPLTPGV